MLCSWSPRFLVLVLSQQEQAHFHLTRRYCPYCTRVKSLFSELNVDAKVFELDNMGGEP